MPAHPTKQPVTPGLDLDLAPAPDADAASGSGPGSDPGGIDSLARTNPAYRPRLRGVAGPPRAASARPAGQAKLSRSVIGLQAMAARLTPRDRWLLWMLLEHQVLTSAQITDLAFGSQRMSNARLNTLHRLGAVDRFRPFTVTGSAPSHMVLAPLGAQVLAGDLNAPVEALDFDPQRLARLAVALHLAHTVGTNGVFTRLARQARSSPGQAADKNADQDAGEAAGEPAHPRDRLRAWWSERRCLEAWDGLIRPDGYGRWSEPTTTGGRGHAEVDFFLEYDTGTENLDRVVTKLVGYAALAASSGIVTPILFWLPTPARERHLRAAITAWLSSRPGAAGHLPVATSTGRLQDGRPGRGPADAVWMALTTPASLPRAAVTGRARLIQLAHPAMPPAATPLREARPSTGRLPRRHLQAPPPTAPSAFDAEPG